MQCEAFPLNGYKDNPHPCLNATLFHDKHFSTSNAIKRVSKIGFLGYLPKTNPFSPLFLAKSYHMSHP